PMFWKKRDPQWEKGIKQLQGYKRVNGDANVPIMYVCADGFRLGSWLHGQKRIGKRLAPERLKALTECGVVLA
ncbi:MAG: hypothetical protein GWP45_03960, partial [Proteobacteria bacterium]|nr:hypothetical protein [Pseudomonadota bacterium]